MGHIDMSNNGSFLVKPDQIQAFSGRLLHCLAILAIIDLYQGGHKCQLLALPGTGKAYTTPAGRALRPLPALYPLPTTPPLPHYPPPLYVPYPACQWVYTVPGPVPGPVVHWPHGQTDRFARTRDKGPWSLNSERPFRHLKRQPARWAGLLKQACTGPGPKMSATLRSLFAAFRRQRARMPLEGSLRKAAGPLGRPEMSATRPSFAGPYPGRPQKIRYSSQPQSHPAAFGRRRAVRR